MSDIILVGGSKNGTVTEGASGLGAVHNIVVNEAKDGPEFIDRYETTGMKDKEGRLVFVHTGRYDAEESKSYWDTLPQEKIAELIAAQDAEREEERLAAEAEEKAKAEAAAEEEVAAEQVEAGTINAEVISTEGAEEKTQDEETGEVVTEAAETNE